MAFLDQNPGLGYPAAAAFGLALGSFLNVVILRLPRRLEWE
jgi:leader peptidase (prepilin peptidase)/N-methyltransferase